MRYARALFVLALLLAAPACRQHRYFVDMDRAVNESDNGKRGVADTARAIENARRQFAEADAVAKKAEDAKEPDAAAKRAHANETAQRLQRDVDQVKEGKRLIAVTGIKRALLRVAADRRVDVIELASSVAYHDPDRDVTAETIRRANDNSKADENETLRAENERLKAKAK